MSAICREPLGNRKTVNRRFSVRIAVAAILCVHSIMLAWIAYRYSPTVDEPAHLVSGISHWKFGRFDLYRVNPPLVRLVAGLPMLLVEPKTDWSAFTEAPYSRPEFTIGINFTEVNQFDASWYFTLARWACIPFSLLGGWVCYAWASELYGTASGILALVLWCFCPNVVGNGALITPDVAAAGFGVAAAYCYWRWLRLSHVQHMAGAPGEQAGNIHCRPDQRLGDWSRALVAGLTLGLAELTKSTWIILFGVWPLLWIVSLQRRPRLSDGTAAATPAFMSSRPHIAEIVQLTLILVVAVYVLNLGYGFENSFQRLDNFKFISHALGGPDAHEKPGNRFVGTWLGAVPVPAPANYLNGIDVQRYDFEIGKWSYLHGEQKIGGWWYYYLYAMTVKMPIGALLLISLATMLPGARMMIGARWKQRDAPYCASPANDNSTIWLVEPQSAILDVAAVLAPAVVLIALVSSQTGFNRYLRYVIPAFPFLFIWASQLFRSFRWNGVLNIESGMLTFIPQSVGKLGNGRGAGRRYMNLASNRIRIVVAVLLSSVVSSLSVFPHSLSYFNEVAGGPMNGHNHLLDANIDWGQDLLELKRWNDARPESMPLYVAYFGLIDSRITGIKFETVQHSITVDSMKGTCPPPGWYAISANELYGYKYFGERIDNYAWFRQLQPAARAGYSICIYHVSAEMYSRLQEPVRQEPRE